MLKKILKYILIAGLFWFIIHSLYITYDGFTEPQQKADLAVVFGNKVNEDGTLSPRLKARLDKSIELYHNKQVKNILVSGGLGKEGYWEGTEMKKYLIKNKIPTEKILVDNSGNNTEKTVINTIKIADSLKFSKVISVSQFYHQTRIKKLFREHNFKNIESSSPTYFEIRDLYSVFREFFAYYL
ncbi:YdcF family protein [Chryseobacterium joostei]|uniref:Protein SanA, affects membrane permeability for vancomycin n=1 Tax=Chryseobacterium joostei TaxID=112234 RepID=A0A1N7II14_9FLAO|nr:YdcF family protein [Chryseobacterium joostei]AZB00394.1 YdcF family protein [Chryseobacterium joostei]SIS36690.1 protein SanA, affects membrane permeability for vancomycin [Chryseobacterium joostei]